MAILSTPGFLRATGNISLHNEMAEIFKGLKLMGSLVTIAGKVAGELFPWTHCSNMSSLLLKYAFTQNTMIFTIIEGEP